MSELKVNKISPASGTATTIGDSGDTFTVPSGVTLAVAGALNVTGTTALADGTVAIAELDIDGGTDIGEAIVDADLLIIDNGAGGTNRKTAASRLKTYVHGAGTVDIAGLDIDGATDIGAAIVDADLLIIDDGAGGTNRKVAASRLKTYVEDAAGEVPIANLNIDGGTDIGADISDADLFIIDDGAGGTNRKVAASRLKTYNPGGVQWQAVVTGATTMVAGRGYFVNTTSSAFTMTLPASPSIGDYVRIIDYAGTFDSNTCTVGRNSQKIAGASADMTVTTERAGLELVFTDSTQGWLLTEK